MQHYYLLINFVVNFQCVKSWLSVDAVDLLLAGTWIWSVCVGAESCW